MLVNKRQDVIEHNMELIEKNRTWTKNRIEILKPHLDQKSNVDRETQDRFSIVVDNACVVFAHTFAFNKPTTGNAIPLEYEIEEKKFESRFNFLLEHFFNKISVNS